MDKHDRLVGFPVLAPGELLYSAIARFDALNGRWSRADTVERSTGIKRWNKWSSTTFPTYVRNLSERLPEGHPQADECLLAKKHTLLSFNTYFLSRARATIVQERLLAGTKDYQKKTLAVRRRADFGATNPLMLCSDCVAEDHERGFTYWHIEHQIPGNTRCPHHLKPLTLGCEVCDGTRDNFVLINPSPTKVCPHGENGRYVFEQRGKEAEAADLISRNLARMHFQTDGFPGAWGPAIQKGLQEVGLHKDGRVNISAIHDAGLSQPWVELLDKTADDFFKWTKTSIRFALDTLTGRGHPLVMLAITMLVRPSLEDFEREFSGCDHVDEGALPDWWWPEDCLDAPEYQNTKHTFGEMRRRFGVGSDEVANLIGRIKGHQPGQRKVLTALEKRVVFAIAHFAPSFKKMALITGIVWSDLTALLEKNKQASRRIELCLLRVRESNRNVRRKIFTDYLAANPDVAREDLRSGNSLNWLRLHDEKWLQTVLPPSHALRRRRRKA